MEVKLLLDTGESYILRWCGNKKRRDAEVGILVRKTADFSIDKPDVAEPRLIAMNINAKGFSVRLVIGYAPTNCDGTDNQKDSFYRSLKKACVKQQKQQKLVVYGQFNATTSVALQQCYFDRSHVFFNDLLCNDNGSRIKTVCRSMKL